jgi:hypothetical protein
MVAYYMVHRNTHFFFFLFHFFFELQQNWSKEKFTPQGASGHVCGLARIAHVSRKY